MKICINPKTHHQLVQGSLYQPKQRTSVREIPQNYLIYLHWHFKKQPNLLSKSRNNSLQKTCVEWIFEKKISNIGFEVLIHSKHIVQAMFCVRKWNLDITSKPEYATSQNCSFFRKCYLFAHSALFTLQSALSARHDTVRIKRRPKTTATMSRVKSVYPQKAFYALLHGSVNKYVYDNIYIAI